MVRYVIGDATEPQAERVIIAHVVNNRGGWGAGFSGALSKRYPEAEAIYRSFTSRKLGKIQTLYPSEHVAIVNMIAQNGYKSAANPVPLSYPALTLCLREVAKIKALIEAFYNGQEFVVQMPRIGAGLAGGDWERIESSINTFLPEAIIVDLP